MKSKAFTLIEVIVATFIITVGIGGVYVLIQKTISDTTLLTGRFTAIYLAQEGVEIVKNIRDTNFIKIYEGELSEDQWTQGLTGCESGCGADFNDSFLSLGNDDIFLKKDEGGFYDYESVTDAPFKRKITIFDLVDLDGDDIDDQIKVLVEVSWKEKGNDYKVTVQENVYNWWQKI